jgi:uncharacterized protein DUF4259
MSGWDCAPFDNDTAADFAADLDGADESARLGMLRAALAAGPAVPVDRLPLMRCSARQQDGIVRTILQELYDFASELSMGDS